MGTEILHEDGQTDRQTNRQAGRQKEERAGIQT
jgi:hypothetical protein